MARLLRFEVTHVVPASSHAIWDVLGDFGSEHRWTRSLSQCERDTVDVRVGTVRSCRLPRPLMGRDHVRETLTEYEPRHVLAYSLDGAAGPFASASSRWSTRQMSSGSTALTVEGRFQPRNRVVPILVWPFLKPVLRRLTRRVIRELEAFVLGR